MFYLSSVAATEMAYIVATKKNNMVIEGEGTNIYLRNLDPGKGT